MKDAQKEGGETVSFPAAAGHTVGGRGALVHCRMIIQGSQPMGLQDPSPFFLPMGHFVLAGQDGSGMPKLGLELLFEKKFFFLRQGFFV